MLSIIRLRNKIFNSVSERPVVAAIIAAVVVKSRNTHLDTTEILFTRSEIGRRKSSR